MATDPSFAATPRLGAALLGSAETNLQVPTQSSSVLVAGSSGTKIDEIVVVGTATSLVNTTVAGCVYVFAYDGTTYHLYDVIQITAVTGSSTETTIPRWSATYANFVLPSGWTLKCSQSVAGNASLLKVLAHGADL